MQVACANFTGISSIAGKYPTIFYRFVNFFANFDNFGTIFVNDCREREREVISELRILPQQIIYRIYIPVALFFQCRGFLFIAHR